MPSKIRIINVVGARPQIIKASAITRIIASEFNDSVEEVIVHTGQHYDHDMSDVFFGELDIPLPHYNLNVGSASHGQQTALMITGIEEILIKEKPDAVIIYGDTNSTLAAAVASSKIHVPLVHIEAGLRSYRKEMPEEVNRVLADHVSTLLFAPTDAALKNLIREGFRPENSPPFTMDNPKVFLSGDIMYDNSLYYASLAEERLTGMAEKLGVEKGKYILATIHRPSNTDSPERLGSIMGALSDIADESGETILIPLHPRTVKALGNVDHKSAGSFRDNRGIQIIPPASFLEMTYLEKNCRMIITDSGGVQKEAHFFSKPSLVLREVTEWVELVNNGTTVLAGSGREGIVDSYRKLARKKNLAYPKFYGDGMAARTIISEIAEMVTGSKSI